MKPFSNVFCSDRKTALILLRTNTNLQPKRWKEILQIFIDNEADVNAADSNGMTPLLKLCFHCSVCTSVPVRCIAKIMGLGELKNNKYQDNKK